MRIFISDDTLRRLRHVGPYRELIAHCATHDQHSRLMAGEVSDEAFEVVGGSILAEDIVQQAGVRDGVEHGRSGSRDDIAWILVCQASSF